MPQSALQACDKDASKKIYWRWFVTVEICCDTRAADRAWRWQMGEYAAVERRQLGAAGSRSENVHEVQKLSAQMRCGGSPDWTQRQNFFSAATRTVR